MLATLKRIIETEIDVNSLDLHNDINEIFQLIEREKDMISRKRPKKSLRGLRARLLNKYFALLLIPQFNPAAARFSKTPRYVSRKIKPKLVSRAYDKSKHIKRKHAVTANTKTLVQFNVG